MPITLAVSLPGTCYMPSLIVCDAVCGRLFQPETGLEVWQLSRGPQNALSQLTRNLQLPAASTTCPLPFAGLSVVDSFDLVAKPPLPHTPPSGPSFPQPTPVPSSGTVSRPSFHPISIVTGDDAKARDDDDDDLGASGGRAALVRSGSALRNPAARPATQTRIRCSVAMIGTQVLVEDKQLEGPIP
eukprot:88969-Rhodomonas_salina.2